jgi:hypothetical protein
MHEIVSQVRLQISLQTASATVFPLLPLKMVSPPSFRPATLPSFRNHTSVKVFVLLDTCTLAPTTFRGGWRAAFCHRLDPQPARFTNTVSA